MVFTGGVSCDQISRPDADWYHVIESIVCFYKAVSFYTVQARFISEIKSPIQQHDEFLFWIFYLCKTFLDHTEAQKTKSYGEFPRHNLLGFLCKSSIKGTFVIFENAWIGATRKKLAFAL